MRRYLLQKVCWRSAIINATNEKSLNEKATRLSAGPLAFLSAGKERIPRNKGVGGKSAAVNLFSAKTLLAEAYKFFNLC